MKSIKTLLKVSLSLSLVMTTVLPSFANNIDYGDGLAAKPVKIKYKYAENSNDPENLSKSLDELTWSNKKAQNRLRKARDAKEQRCSYGEYDFYNRIGQDSYFASWVEVLRKEMGAEELHLEYFETKVQDNPKYGSKWSRNAFVSLQGTKKGKPFGIHLWSWTTDDEHVNDDGFSNETKRRSAYNKAVAMYEAKKKAIADGEMEGPLPPAPNKKEMLAKPPIEHDCNVVSRKKLTEKVVELTWNKMVANKKLELGQKDVQEFTLPSATIPQKLHGQVVTKSYTEVPFVYTVKTIDIARSNGLTVKEPFTFGRVMVDCWDGTNNCQRLARPGALKLANPN